MSRICSIQPAALTFAILGLVFSFTSHAKFERGCQTLLLGQVFETTSESSELMGKISTAYERLLRELGGEMLNTDELEAFLANENPNSVEDFFKVSADGSSERQVFVEGLQSLKNFIDEKVRKQELQVLQLRTQLEQSVVRIASERGYEMVKRREALEKRSEIRTVLRTISLKRVQFPSDTMDKFAISPDGLMLAMSSTTRAPTKFSVYSAKTGKLLHRGKVTMHTGPISEDRQEFKFSPDSKYLYVTDGNAGYCIWNTATWTHWKNKKKADEGSRTLEMAFSHDSETIYIGDGFGAKVHAYQLSTGKEVFTITYPDADFSAFAVSSDNQHLVTINSIGVIQLWNAKTGEPERTLKTKIKYASRIRFIGSDNAVLIELDPGIKIVSLSDPAKTISMKVQPLRSVISPNAKYISENVDSKVVRLWNTASGKSVKLQAPRREVSYSAATFTFSPSQRYLIALNVEVDIDQYQVIAWDVESGKIVRQADISKEVELSEFPLIHGNQAFAEPSKNSIHVLDYDVLLGELE